MTETHTLSIRAHDARGRKTKTKTKNEKHNDMNKLLTIITAAIAAVLGYKEAIDKLTADANALRDYIAELEAQINKLKADLAADQVDDAELEANAAKAVAECKAAQARADELNAQLASAAAAAAELAGLINANPDTPVIDADFRILASSGEAMPPPAEEVRTAEPASPTEDKTQEA